MNTRFLNVAISLRKNLNSYKIQNRQAKSLLIDYYGKNICFTNPREVKEVFSESLHGKQQ